MRSHLFALACFAAIGLSAPLTAQPDHADDLYGRSYHGEVFNEGPRQKAYLMGKTGNVRFPITTKSSEAQKFFEQGVGQLHGLDRKSVV